MDLQSVKNLGFSTVVCGVVFSLLNLNLFVTQAQLADQLRQLEAKIRSEYATKADIQDIKDGMRQVNTKLDQLTERLLRVKEAR